MSATVATRGRGRIDTFSRFGSRHARSPEGHIWAVAASAPGQRSPDLDRATGVLEHMSRYAWRHNNCGAAA